MDWNHIRQLAEDVRAWAEEYAKRFGPTYYSEGLAGMCGKASARLHTMLTNEGFPAKIGHACGHIFVLVGEGEDLDQYKIVDVTATQFHDYIIPNTMEKVVILDMNSQRAKENYYWKIYKVHNNADDLLHYQSTSKWPMQQSVRPHEYKEVIEDDGR